MKYYLIVEALCVGIFMYIVGKILEKMKIEKDLFVCGFLGHILFEIIGVNKWYCKNGIACKSIR